MQVKELKLKYMNGEKIKIGDYKFTFKYCGNEALAGERTRTDGYRAFVVGNDKNGSSHKIFFELFGTSYNSKNDEDQKFISDVIQDKYDNLENCFYQVAVKYLKERISQNNFENEKINIMDYLFKQEIN